MTPAMYDEILATHHRPYVYQFDSSAGGSAAVIGAEHTKDPNNPQLEQIRTLWDQFEPTIALVESDLGVLFPSFMDPVQTFGEVGLVHELARSDGVPTNSWEPPDTHIVDAALDQGFSPEQVALRWVLGPYFSNRRFGRPDDPVAFVADTLAERSSVDGIAGMLNSVGEVDAAWSRHFPHGPDWRDASDQYGLPGFLGDIDLNAPRDDYLVACVADLLGRGERVFVICGLSHAVKIEPAVRSLAKP